MTTAAQLSENSHQGFDGIKAALCLASMKAKSNTASGMPVCLWRNGIGSRSSGKERDTETGLDYFMARYLSSAQGRFTTPDPLLASARLTDPQTWNRYAYVRNNPVNLVDPDGRMTSEIQYAMMMGMALPFVNGVSGSQNFADTAFSGYMRSQEIFNNEQYFAYCLNHDQVALAAFISDTYAMAAAAKKSAVALPEGTVTIVEGSKVVTGKPENGCSEIVIKGDATYYNLVGRKTASGQLFNPNSSNAAMYQRGVIRMGDTVTVQLQNEPSKSVTVTVNDTGPFLRGSDGRAIYPLQPDPNIVIDLTPAAFRDLAGSTAVGRVPVVVTRSCPVP